MALGNKFELTELTSDELNGINAEVSLDMDFISQLDELEGQTIIERPVIWHIRWDYAQKCLRRIYST